MRTFIIAELSANHNNDYDLAVRTMEAMANAGADAVKLQTYRPTDLQTYRPTDRRALPSPWIPDIFLPKQRGSGKDIPCGNYIPKQQCPMSDSPA